MTRGVAAFDFDGTITQRDTLVPFLANQGRRRFVSGSALAAINSLRGARGAYRDRMKARVVRAIFAGRPVEPVERAARTYAARLPAGYRRSSLERIEWHRSEGHQLILVTGSLGMYARPAGAALGFDHVIAVELETDDSGRFTGEMTGPNVRRDRKVDLLRAHLDGEEVELWAYGNSAGDKQLLAMADHPTWVGRRRSGATASR